MRCSQGSVWQFLWCFCYVCYVGGHWRKGIMIFSLYFKIQKTSQSYDIPDDSEGETSQTEGETLLCDTGLPVCIRRTKQKLRVRITPKNYTLSKQRTRKHVILKYLLKKAFLLSVSKENIIVLSRAESWVQPMQFHLFNKGGIGHAHAQSR